MHESIDDTAYISVIIPVYKSDECLHELYVRLISSLEPIFDNIEIILVEDCGGDKSWEIISNLAEQDPRVKGLQFSRNFGQHYGITAGLDYCNGDWIVVMDCDLQDKPEEIPRLYAKVKEGYDVVLARRENRQDDIIKRFTSWLFYRLLSYLADVQYDPSVGNFRIISRQVVDNFRHTREQLRFFSGLIDWMGFPTASINVKHDSRFSGKSSYTFKKLWKLATDTVIAYSDKPLRLSIKLGFIIAFIALLAGIILAARFFIYGSSVIGWSSLIVSLYFLSGVILLVLGINGIYLGKIFNETKKRPLYIVRRKTFSND